MGLRKERQKVLQMLEAGRIGPEEAEGLLEAMGPGGGEKVVLELDADRDNLRQVLRILSKAFGK